jgi:hypothetical protein
MSSISGINSSGMSIADLTMLSGAGLPGASVNASSLQSSLSSSSSTVNLSNLAQQFSKLQEVQDTDPEAAKTLMASIAESLKQQAVAFGADSNLSVAFASMAAKYGAAAESGDISSLSAKQPAYADPLSYAVQSYEDASYQENQEAVAKASDQAFQEAYNEIYNPSAGSQYGDYYK